MLLSVDVNPMSNSDVEFRIGCRKLNVNIRMRNRNQMSRLYHSVFGVNMTRTCMRHEGGSCLGIQYKKERFCITFIINSQLWELTIMAARNSRISSHRLLSLTVIRGGSSSRTTPYWQEAECLSSGKPNLGTDSGEESNKMI